jgi:hypothetical protein
MISPKIGYLSAWSRSRICWRRFVSIVFLCLLGGLTTTLCYGYRGCLAALDELIDALRVGVGLGEKFTFARQIILNMAGPDLFAVRVANAAGTPSAWRMPLAIQRVLSRSSCFMATGSDFK